MPKYMASTRISASPEKVWEIVVNGDRMADWLSAVGNVEKVEPSGPLAKGSKMEVSIGKVGGAKINIKEATPGRTLRWSAGPFLAHMMRMPMGVQLDLEGQGDATDVTITFKTNPMMAPIMKMMTGLNFSDEAPATMRDLKAAVEAA